MPGTAGDLGVDRCDPESNARGGVRYLKSLGIQFGNPVFALAAYNAGPENVLRHKGVPPFIETIHYIASVLTKYYGSPTQLGAVATAKPARKVKRPDDLVKSTFASETPASKVWASGFVMHLN